MQQNMFPEHNESDSKNKVSSLGRGLAIHFIKPGSEARLFRQGVFTKTVDLSDKTARRLFIVDTVELGATKALLAKALGISRQTIHNYIETQKNFGREGLIHSYHARHLSLQWKIVSVVLLPVFLLPAPPCAWLRAALPCCLLRVFLCAPCAVLHGFCCWRHGSCESAPHDQNSFVSRCSCESFDG